MNQDAPFRLASAEDGRWELKLTGAVTAESCEALHHAVLDAASNQPVRVDLSDADALDLSIVQILLALKASLETRGATLQVDGASPDVTAILALAGCTGPLGLATAESEACQ